MANAVIEANGGVVEKFDDEKEQVNLGDEIAKEAAPKKEAKEEKAKKPAQKKPVAKKAPKKEEAKAEEKAE